MRHMILVVFAMGVLIGFSQASHAKDLSSPECRQIAVSIVGKFTATSLKYAPLRVVAEETKDAHIIKVSVKTIPEAYLIELEKSPNLSHEVYMTKEVREKFDNISMESVGMVHCPKDINNGKQREIMQTDLARIVERTNQYLENHKTTVVAQKFHTQFHAVFDPEYRAIQDEVKNKYSGSHSIEYGIWLRERFTDYSFGELRIIYRYGAILWNHDEGSMEDARSALDSVLKKQPKWFEITIRIKGRSQKQIESEILKGATELKAKMMEHIRMILLGGNPTAV